MLDSHYAIQSLELNPQTFTPEILLIAAKVLNVNLSDSTVRVQRLPHPGGTNPSLSGLVVPVDPGMEEGGVEEEIEEHPCGDFEVLDWRVLQKS